MRFAACFAAAALCASPALAQDVERKVQIVVDAEGQPGVARVLQMPINEAASKYWIGVMATPVNATMKAQLRLENGLAVEQVVDDGPAKDAGVKQHDILLKFNKTALTDVGSLIKAVEKSEGKKAQLTILRGGSEKKLEVAAKERPKTDRPVTLQWKANPQGWWMSNANENMMLFGPGMRLMPGQNLKDLKVELETVHDGDGEGQKQMSITVKRKDDKPAQITVKREGKTYEVTEESIDKLPKDIRVIVKKHLDGNKQNVWRHMQWHRPEIRLGVPTAPVAPGAPIAPGMHIHSKHIEAQMKHMEKMMKRMEQILEEVESLKREPRRRGSRNRDEEETVDA